MSTCLTNMVCRGVNKRSSLERHTMISPSVIYTTDVHLYLSCCRYYTCYHNRSWENRRTGLRHESEKLTEYYVLCICIMYSRVPRVCVSKLWKKKRLRVVHNIVILVYSIRRYQNRENEWKNSHSIILYCS